MANIMLTDSCNLKCPYCFANEFVNKAANEISEYNFKKAVEFILADKSTDVIGLIGGEPTLHSRFSDFVRTLILDERVQRIVIYTNGVFLDRYWDIICHPKIHYLINCNSSNDMGKNMYDRMLSNIDYLVDKRLFKDNVTLGINMYKPDFEYDYLITLLNKYHYNHARVSITVPNLDDERNIDAHQNFNCMKSGMLGFFQDLLEHGIVPNFDCNKIPYCLLTEEEISRFKPFFSDLKLKKVLDTSNIVNDVVACSPVVDIRQDLTAVRCFGLSQYTKVSIDKFKGIKDLINYYLETVDAFAYNLSYSSKCNDCYQRKVLRCSGGCIAYKIDKIIAMQEYGKHLNDSVN